MPSLGNGPEATVVPLKIRRRGSGGSVLDIENGGGRPGFTSPLPLFATPLFTTPLRKTEVHLPRTGQPSRRPDHHQHGVESSGDDARAPTSSGRSCEVGFTFSLTTFGQRSTQRTVLLDGNATARIGNSATQCSFVPPPGVEVSLPGLQSGGLVHAAVERQAQLAKPAVGRAFASSADSL